MAWHLILCSISYTERKESNKRVPGRVVIYISAYLVLIYTFALMMSYSPEKWLHNTAVTGPNTS